MAYANAHKKNKTKNIVVLGETGVGKSTFLNAFANYLNFGTIGEAQDADELILLIPTKFSIFDGDLNARTVVGKVTTNTEQSSNENEDSTEGQSATQNCRSHLFPFEDLTVRIIDTPGIGDTRGIEMDKKNFDNILSYISQFNELHAILILMKPNMTRLTPSFQYCLKQLLCQLSTSAGANIVFVFTNCRSTFYQPGQTLGLLEQELNKINQNRRTPIINLNKNTVYCLDNEGFRFLLAIQNEIYFNKKMRKDFANSWIQASDECRRLMDYVVGIDKQPGLKPHKTSETITVNEVRRWVINLSKPLADIASNIQDNVRVLQEHEQDIVNSSNNIDQLNTKLFVPVIDLKFTELDHPATVCAHKDCADTFQLATTGIQQWHYRRRCHPHCYLKNVAKEILGDVALTGCAAMDGNRKCRVCGHEYTVHMHVYYESEIVSTKIEDNDIKRQIETKEDLKKAAEMTVKLIKERCAKFEIEKTAITKATAMFAGFLSKKAIVPYNDSFKLYVEHLIENQKSLNQKGSNNQDTIDGLTKMLLEYDEEVEVITKAMSSKSGKSKLKENDIHDAIQELFKLEIYGKKIEDICNQQTKIRWIETNKEQSIYKPQGMIQQFFEWGKNKLGFGSNKKPVDSNNNEPEKSKSIKPNKKEEKKSKTTKKNKKSEKEEKLPSNIEALINSKFEEIRIKDAKRKKKEEKNRSIFDSSDIDLFADFPSTSSPSPSHRRISSTKKQNPKKQNDKFYDSDSSIDFNSNGSRHSVKPKPRGLKSKLDSDSGDSDDEIANLQDKLNQLIKAKKAAKKLKNRKKKPPTPTPTPSDSETEDDSDQTNDQSDDSQNNLSESSDSDSDKGDKIMIELKKKPMERSKR